MGPLDGKKIKDLGSPANATHLSYHTVACRFPPTREHRDPFGCTERSLAAGAAVTNHRATDPRPVGNRFEGDRKAAVDMMFCVRRGGSAARGGRDPR
jgi:hypothetical protein